MTVDWWTLGLQTVNFLVLVWILMRFLFRPIREIVAKRQQAAAKVLADAEAARGNAAQLLDDAHRARAELDAERERLMASAQSDAEREHLRLLDEARNEADKVIDEAKSAAAKQRVALEQGLIDEVRDLSLAIASRLVAKLPPDAALDMFLEALCGRIAALRPEVRAAFAGPGTETEVVTASLLSAAEQQRVAGRLDSAFETSLRLRFRSDPTVIAGIELSAPHASIRSSWRDDLDHIREELTSDKPPAG